jgi:alanine-alpha-ketoisovalerate/valine-pyruvate aminotransferase
VSGYSKGDNKDFFVVINGKILGTGDRLNEMLITEIKPRVVLLEKGPMKYKIDFNLQ